MLQGRNQLVGGVCAVVEAGIQQVEQDHGGSRERGSGTIETSFGPAGSACSGLISLRRKEAIGCNLPPSNTWNSSRVRSATDCPRPFTAATFSLIKGADGGRRSSPWSLGRGRASHAVPAATRKPASAHLDIPDCRLIQRRFEATLPEELRKNAPASGRWQAKACPTTLGTQVAEA